MLVRLFAVALLMVLVAGGLYYWKIHPEGARDLGAVGRHLEDAKTTASVSAALGLSRSLKPYAIDASTEGGVVTLRGEVPREELRVLAERTTAAVPDVRQVVNHLRVRPGAEVSVEPGRSFGETLDDEALEVQVRLAFSLNRQLSGAELRVRAFRRHVTVSGDVEGAGQRDLALALARETSGVAGVRDEVRVHGVGTASSPAAAVERALAANSSLASYRIRVVEEGGRLLLKGRVRSGAEKDLAGLIATQAAAGTSVENHLELRR